MTTLVENHAPLTFSVAPPRSKWTHVRRQFAFADNLVNFAGMALASHPKVVTKAIQRFRKGLDERAYLFLKDNLHACEDAVAAKAAVYFGAGSANIALTDGTTQGLTLLYAGLPFKPGQEILTTEHEFSGVLQIFEYLTQRQGTPVNRIRLIDNAATITEAEILNKLAAAVTPKTRVLALTWVYSNTGVKMPLAKIADWLRDVNRGRPADEAVLLCVDGVHGFGVEDTTFAQLGCDFFASGCHKWVCGPRGTGIWVGTTAAWEQYQPVAPTSSRANAGIGRDRSPGGVQSYEHRWALAEAFDFLLDIGRAEIQARVHGLASIIKTELEALPRIRLVTPRSPSLSAGIICFDVDGMTATDAVDALGRRGIVATQSSIDSANGARHARLSVSIFNNESDIEGCLSAITAL